MSSHTYAVQSRNACLYAHPPTHLWGQGVVLPPVLRRRGWLVLILTMLYRIFHLIVIHVIPLRPLRDRR